jgi:trans-aconitate 2-methyltransferase
VTPPPAAREWDAATYDRVADPQTRWGASVLERVDPATAGATGAVVLDAGCGSGRVTEQLLQRFPDATVVALDGSAAMVEQAKARLEPSFAGRVRYVHADLQQPLPDGVGPVDAIVSTATFHWVPDHDALFRSLAAVVRPGGQFVFQCGGKGNIDSIVRVLGELAPDAPSPWTYADPPTTTERLRAAGFTDVECWLHDEPTPFPDDESLATFMRTVILAPYLDRMPDGERDGFVAAVAARLPDRTIDYVRLNVVARKGSSS